MKQMTLQEALSFFAELFGDHHRIKSQPKRVGYGYYTIINGISTWDYSFLTKFVLLCHEMAYRGELSPHSKDKMKITIHKRERALDLISGHPTIEQAIEIYNNTPKKFILNGTIKP
jgi:hypothetical protein